jgi:phosphoenolpyruvate---glycerone phosphotransferase subunit DhaL
MRDEICITELRCMFAEAAKRIRQEHAELSRLDSIGGDGDHGTTMLRAVEELEEAFSAGGEKALSVRLKDAGWRVLGVDGGASSAILGTFIAGMGDEDLGQESDCKHLAASLAAGLGAVAKQTKARPGDKTMMDALQPAVEAFDAAARAGKHVEEAMQDAAAAAQTGADRTKEMIARFGRAKFLGEKTRGTPDAGATSIALLFRGFSEALMQEEEA